MFTEKNTKSCDEFEQVNSGWLILYVSAARVNQFEMKVFDFLINASRQVNNVRIKLNLKINLKRP